MTSMCQETLGKTIENNLLIELTVSGMGENMLPVWENTQKKRNSRTKKAVKGLFLEERPTSKQDGCHMGS